MARRQRQAVVHGPYQHGKRYRIILVDERGHQVAQSYDTEAQAAEVKRAALKQIGLQTSKTVDEVIGLYGTYLEKVKQNRPGSIATTGSRLRSFFAGRLDTPIATITPQIAARCYTDLAARTTRTKKQMTVDTHRNS